jgi:hypothetical protein
MMYQKPTPRDLRRVNRSQILHPIYFGGEISRLEHFFENAGEPDAVTVGGRVLAPRSGGFYVPTLV